MFLYNFGLSAYASVGKMAALFNSKIRKMVEGQRETADILRKGIAPDDRVVWFHAASLGEFEQGRPIMERLRKQHPEYKILLSFFSPSAKALTLSASTSTTASRMARIFLVLFIVFIPFSCIL